MGRKTWDSIRRKPLPNRFNIIVSSQTEKELDCEKYIESACVVNSLDEALDTSTQIIGAKESFIIGGSSLYKEAVENRLEDCKNIFKTRIGQNFEGDTIFDDSEFLKKMFLSEVSKTYSENKINFDFVRFVNPNLYPDYFEEFNMKLVNSKSEEFQYLDLIEDIIAQGNEKKDRTGTGTLSTFGNVMKFDLSHSFPLLTTKRVFWKGVVEELLWFLKGSTNSNHLSEKGVKIWDANGSKEFLINNGFKNREQGDLGPVYGFQWRHAGAEYKDYKTDYTAKGIDQISDVIKMIKEDPDSRRMIVCSWNVKDISKMALPPCHTLFQFHTQDDKLNCLLYQRSCDVGLGLPFNIGSYALLTCLIAKMTGRKPGQFVHMIGDTHVYLNHVKPLRKQLLRKPDPFPILDIKYDPSKKIEDYSLEDFELNGYHPQKTIKMEMSA